LKIRTDLLIIFLITPETFFLKCVYLYGTILRNIALKKFYFLQVIVTLLCLSSLAQVSLVQFSTGFTNPVDLTHAGDKRIFVVQQGGKIFILDSAGVRKTTPFLDITSRVLSGGEQGLLGLAFPPDYADSGHFYVDYTQQTNGNTRISRFSVSPAKPDSALPNSEQILLNIFQPFTNHNGGNLKFGPDGYLYIGMGDGGSGNDPGNRAQNKDSLLGKMLRIDVRGGGAYTNPPSNPYVGISGRDEIWAYGLRNPWRWSFDRWNGDLWIGDVGQDAYEEIDYQPAGVPGGRNYGWHCYEGFVHTPSVSSCSPTDTTNPVIAISQTTGVCAIIGGYVYRGAEYSNLFGTYFYADECSSNIRTIKRNANGSFIFDTLGTLGGSTLVSFGEDKWGELYVLAYGGTIYKFRGASCSPAAFLSDSDTIHVCGTSYLLKTPEGNGFNYSWSYNGVQVFGANSSTYLATQPGKYKVTATNRSSCSKSDSVYVTFDAGCFVALNLKTFLEGMYSGNMQMRPALFTADKSYDSTACDSITVELHNSTSPYALVFSSKTLLYKNGNASMLFPSSIMNHSYYIAIRHRNCMEVWSKNAVLFNSGMMSFDFTSP
jgi:glucose/arabinose dehydrogenase